jgi:hypothetical protein
VLQPWYASSKRRVLSILDLYGDASDGYGYVPDIENARCADANGPVTWRVSGLMSEPSIVAYRATWYSLATLWYWWFDSNWVPIGD